MSTERVIVFIDGSNFYHTLLDAFGRTSVDFEKLGKELAASRELVRIYYYSAPLVRGHPKAADQQRFFDVLRRVSYLEVQLGVLQPKGNTHVQKGVDVQLAVQMIRFAYHRTYDTAILVSGDADFVPAVQFVKDLGRHVELVVAEGQPCFRLQSACDKVIILSKALMDRCWV